MQAISRVAMVREKYLENNFPSQQRVSISFSQVNLERIRNYQEFHKFVKIFLFLLSSINW